jgi:hypothetical protein
MNKCLVELEYIFIHELIELDPENDFFILFDILLSNQDIFSEAVS